MTFGGSPDRGSRLHNPIPTGILTGRYLDLTYSDRCLTYILTYSPQIFRRTSPALAQDLKKLLDMCDAGLDAATTKAATPAYRTIIRHQAPSQHVITR